MGVGAQVGRLRDVFDSRPVTLEKFNQYQWALSDIPDGMLTRAVDAIIATRQEGWMPTPGEIRVVCAELTLGLPSETEALAQLDARDAWRRNDERPSEPPLLHPTVRAALAAVGGIGAIRGAENPSAARATFARVYRDVRAQELRAATLRPALAAGEPGGQDGQ